MTSSKRVGLMLGLAAGVLAAAIIGKSNKRTKKPTEPTHVHVESPDDSEVHYI